MARDGEQLIPKILELPVGIEATGTRTEFDSMGPIEVPADKYWGAQTQRSLENFNIGEYRMPLDLYRTYGHVKKASAVVNERHGLLPEWKSALIRRVCDEVISGALDEHFPLFVMQTGSGTQSNMNVNEVISNRCIQLLGGTLGSQLPVHPNDDVNMSQSSNDTFPTAMHICAYELATLRTLPSVKALRHAIAEKALQWSDVVKIGRTHLQDATPLTVGQEWSGYVGALDDAIAFLEFTTNGLLEIALGGTAVGTGLNAPAGFAEEVAAELAEQSGFPIRTASNKFTAQGTLDRMVRAHSGLKDVAVTLYKIANDVRWLGSGPRTGLMELHLPENEPGSSIMPGKVNPTQAEAMLMVCMQVIGADVTVSLGGMEGNFELNAFRPILINNYLQSGKLLADASDKFREHMIEGTTLNLAMIESNIDRSMMMVTALSPLIGYNKAADIAHYALANDLPLKEAALSLGVSEELFDEVVIPINMTRPSA